MARQKTGSIVTKNGRLYARVQFVDESGKKRDLWKRVTSKKEAKEKIKELIENSETKTPKELDALRMTFNQLADFYEETYLHEAIYVNERKISGLRNIKTYKYQLQALRAHFRNKLVQSIQYTDLLKYKIKQLQTPLKNGGQRGIAGINRTMQMLRRLLNIGLKQGWLNKNPFHSGDCLISLADEPQRSRILSFAEEIRLLAVIDMNPQRFHLKGIVLIALDCGFRNREIMTLCRKDIDLINRTITIRAFNSKTAKSRKVGMTGRVYRWLSQYENLKNDDKIFPIKNSRSAWNKSIKEAEIEDYHFHDNRHTCISRMIKAGLPHTEVMRLSGHATMVCLYRYINTDEETVFRASNILDAYIVSNLSISQSDNSQFTFIN